MDCWHYDIASHIWTPLPCENGKDWPYVWINGPRGTSWTLPRTVQVVLTNWLFGSSAFSLNTSRCLQRYYFLRIVQHQPPCQVIQAGVPQISSTSAAYPYLIALGGCPKYLWGRKSDHLQHSCSSQLSGGLGLSLSWMGNQGRPAGISLEKLSGGGVRSRCSRCKDLWYGHQHSQIKACKSPNRSLYKALWDEYK